MRQARHQAIVLFGIPSSNRRPNGGEEPYTLHSTSRVDQEEHQEWEECLPITENAYNRARHSTTGKSPFEVVYGFNSLFPLDILPLPLQERTNLDASAHASYIKKMHECFINYRYVGDVSRHSSHSLMFFLINTRSRVESVWFVTSVLPSV